MRFSANLSIVFREAQFPERRNRTWLRRSKLTFTLDDPGVGVG
jgi:hypothetical protein